MSDSKKVASAYPLEPEMKEALQIHHPDGSDRDFDVNYLFICIRNILLPDDQDKQDPLETEEKGHHLMSVIDQISSQISSQAFMQENPHKKASSLLKTLEHYFWDTKLVLTMAAFALSYKICHQLLQNGNISKPLGNISKSLAIFRRVPVMPKDIDKLNERFKELNNGLIMVMKEVTSQVVEFTQLTSIYICMNELEESEAIDPLPAAVYSAIRSVLACVTQIATRIESSAEKKTSSTEAPKDNPTTIEGTDTDEVSKLTKKLQEQCDNLKKQIDACRKYKVKVDDDLNYIKVLNIFDTPHKSNREILEALLPAAKDDNGLRLWDGWWERQVNSDVLIKKQLVLVISSLDISGNERWCLNPIFYAIRRSQDNQHQMLWIPIMDPPPAAESDSNMEKMLRDLKDLRNRIYCYSVFSPSWIKKEVIRLIKDVWHFRNKTIAVLLDSNGNMVRSDAIHMIRIWKGDAFPLTRDKEQSLWRMEKWGLELLVYRINYSVRYWYQNYFFLYGGDDIKWIKDFSKTAREVAKAAGISIRMLYVGKCREREKLERVIQEISKEDLSETWDLEDICFFWDFLESMFSSIISNFNDLDKQDNVMQILLEIYKIFSYVKDDGWVLLSKRDDILVNGPSRLVLRTLKEYDQWKNDVSNKDQFGTCFQNYYNKLLKEDNNAADGDGDGLISRHPPCCQFRFSTTAGISIPKSMKCPACQATMERQFALRCCHKDDITELP